MKKVNIMVVGLHFLDIEFLSKRLQAQQIEIVVAKDKEAHEKNLRGVFDPEPLIIKNFRDQYLGNFNYSEPKPIPEPSKFIGKPLRNYKKR